VKTGCNLAGSSEEGYGLKRAVLPVMVNNNNGKNSNKILIHLHANLIAPRPITK
jgi:hypothetical protein